MKYNLILGMLRNQKKLAQQEIANLLRVSLKTYKQYELGVSVMNLKKLNILSNFYQVSLNYLLGLSNNRKNENINTEINYSLLSRYLTFIRKRNRYSQKDLALLFKISVRSISNYEAKGFKTSIYYLYCFGKKFNISLDYICGKTNKKEIL